MQAHGAAEVEQDVSYACSVGLNGVVQEHWHPNFDLKLCCLETLCYDWLEEQGFSEAILGQDVLLAKVELGWVKVAALVPEAFAHLWPVFASHRLL